MKTSYKYFQKIFSKEKPFEKARRKWNPVPGCLPHRKVVGEQRGRRLFLRYHPRSQKAIDLYWRMHQEEYRQMCRIDERKPF